jgi:hypothetical protein
MSANHSDQLLWAVDTRSDKIDLDEPILNASRIIMIGTSSFQDLHNPV